MRRVARLVSAFLLLTVASSARAAVPGELTFQGYMSDAGGVPLAGAHTIVVTLYSSDASMTPMWREQQTVAVAGGYFSMSLGAGIAVGGAPHEPLAAVFTGGPLFLAVQIDDEAESTERMLIESVPYALRAGAADNVPAQAEIEGWAAGVCYDSAAELRADLDSVYAASSHDHDSDYLPAAYVPSWAELAGVPASFADGVDDVGVTYTASEGVTLVGNDIQLDPSILDGTAYSFRFVERSGGSMSGPLALPANGLAVGGNQLVCTGDRVGIGTTAPTAQVHLVQNSAAWVTPLSVQVNGRNPDDANPFLRWTSVWGPVAGYLSGSATGGTWHTKLNSDGALALATGGVDRVWVAPTGQVGLGTTSPTAALDVAGDALRLRSAKTPASAGAPCNQGEMAWDASYVYVCVATNSWKRSALSSW